MFFFIIVAYIVILYYIKGDNDTIRILYMKKSERLYLIRNSNKNDINIHVDNIS